MVMAKMNLQSKSSYTPNQIQTVPSINLLAEESDGDYVTAVVFGKNAKIIFDKYHDCHAIATSQHAFYFLCVLEDMSGVNICFKSKADRDIFWTSFKKSRFYKNYLETFTDDFGWYCVTHFYGG